MLSDTWSWSHMCRQNSVNKSISQIISLILECHGQIQFLCYIELYLPFISKMSETIDRSHLMAICQWTKKIQNLNTVKWCCLHNLVYDIRKSCSIKCICYSNVVHKHNIFWNKIFCSPISSKFATVKVDKIE
jgi:hypothetical protein